MRVPLLDLRAQYALIKEETREAIDRVMDSQQFILGPEVEALEREVAEYCQCAHGVGVSSGTDALLVSLMAIGLEPGDEVITSPYSFFATAGCIARLGAKPVFVDIDPATFNIDVSKIEAAITRRCKAIIPVHLFGQMADMEGVVEIARERGLWVIEDAAQAIGAESNGRRAGSVGDLGCFSFFPSKNLGGVGDGGMITTNDPDLAATLRSLRNHGYGRKYYNERLGGNFRLDALQAAVLRVKLKYLEGWTRGRRANAEAYRTFFQEAGVSLSPAEVECLAGGGLDRGEGRFADRPGVLPPSEEPGKRHIYNQFVIRAAARDELAAYLKTYGVGCEIYYPVPLHLQECLAGFGYRRGDFAASECAALTTLALPIYPELSLAMQRRVVEVVVAFLRGVAIPSLEDRR